MFLLRIRINGSGQRMSRWWILWIVTKIDATHILAIRLFRREFRRPSCAPYINKD